MGAYKNPTKVLSVDIDAELKAGHCVDPESEIQFCAIAAGIAARIDSRAFLVPNDRIGRCFRSLEPLPRPALEGNADGDGMAGVAGTPNDLIISMLLAWSDDPRSMGMEMMLSWAVCDVSSFIFRFGGPLRHASSRRTWLEGSLSSRC